MKWELQLDRLKRIGKLNSKVAKHLTDFVAMPVFAKSFRDESIALLHEYSATGNEWEHLGSIGRDLRSWHFSQYANAVYNEGRWPLDELALAARYAYANVRFEAAFAQADKGGSVLLPQAMLSYSLNTMAGWRREAYSIGVALYRGLDSSLLDLRHSDQHEKGSLYRHFWFLLQLHCDAHALPLDTSLYSYPDDMSPYAAVLADWRTTDVDKARGFVNAMADFHLQHARFVAHDEVDEFDDEDTMLFPHEILSFLRMREWAGLPNPDQFDHPLMKHPMARMPAPVPLAKPETPLLDAVIAKFQREYPDSFKD